jgi:hypothetical protein
MVFSLCVEFHPAAERCQMHSELCAKILMRYVGTLCTFGPTLRLASDLMTGLRDVVSLSNLTNLGERALPLRMNLRHTWEVYLSLKPGAKQFFCWMTLLSSGSAASPKANGFPCR